MEEETPSQGMGLYNAPTRNENTVEEGRGEDGRLSLGSRGWERSGEERAACEHGFT